MQKTPYDDLTFDRFNEIVLKLIEEKPETYDVNDILQFKKLGSDGSQYDLYDSNVKDSTMHIDISPQYEPLQILYKFDEPYRIRNTLIYIGYTPSNIVTINTDDFNEAKQKFLRNYNDAITKKARQNTNKWLNKSIFGKAINSIKKGYTYNRNRRGRKIGGRATKRALKRGRRTKS
jgi:hypothetical protein